MHQMIANMMASEVIVGHGIRIVGIAIDILGVFVIVVGIAWSSYLFLRRGVAEQRYDAYKIRVGQSLLLGLEFLVAADIVKTIAVEPTFAGLGVLGGLVLVRTFLSWTLVLEIEGHWPWQHATARAGLALDPRAVRIGGVATRQQEGSLS